jgi:hypothetical protein
MNSFPSKSLSIGALTLILGVVAGCGSGSSTKGTGGTTGGGTGGSTGGGTGGSTGGLSRFVGTWHPTSGTTTLICAGQPTVDQVTSNLTWAAGVSPNTVVQTDGTCVLNANVTGSTAAALPSQSCTQMMSGLSLTLTFSAYTFSLSADGMTATENASGNATVFEGGVTVICSYSESAGYQKISN